MYTVYKHTTPDGKVYIGITQQNCKYRWNKGNGYKTNLCFYNAIQKYGWNNISHEILDTNLTKEKAEQLEIRLIAQYHSNDPENGFNFATGGSKNSKFHLSDAAKEKIRLSRLGNRNPMYGRSPWNKGKSWDDETKQKISQSEKGKKVSAETKQKISNSLKGEKSPLRKCVINTDTGEFFPSISVASEKTDIARICICNACNGKQQTAGGFHWRYAD